MNVEIEEYQRKSRFPDPGALYSQAITTYLLLANINSIITHSNTSYIAVDLLDITEQ